MAITGNKGEWSEIYALLKLLGDTKVYSGDGDLNRIEDLFYPIIKILRTENGSLYSYNVESDIVIIKGGREELRISVSEFHRQASALLQRIKDGTGSSFAVEETEEFMTSINCHDLKAKSGDKTDIRIVIHDLRTGQMPTLGFSIKSRLGKAPTLLNPGVTTNFVYTIDGVQLSKNQIAEINAIDTKSKLRDRLESIVKNGGKLKYNSVSSTVFTNNLILIDSWMPQILSEALKLHYSGMMSGVKDIVDYLQIHNPLGYDLAGNHKYYEYKVKNLLTDVALGMTPAKVWDGHYDANGGYLVVKEDGDVLCYHIYNKNEFEDYLLNNTRFDTPSSSRYGFGKVEESNGNLIMKLNLQIRFK